MTILDINNQLLVEINNLNKLCFRLKEESEFENDDARKVVFRLIGSEIQYLYLSVALSKRLNKLDFYKENNFKLEKLSGNIINDTLIQFYSSLQSSFFILIFIQFENYLRIIGKSNKINDYKISDVYNKVAGIYKLHDETKALFKIVSNIRNTVHNGGFHTNKTELIEYKNIIYNFTQDEELQNIRLPEIMFFTNELLLNIINAINQNSQNTLHIKHNNI